MLNETSLILKRRVTKLQIYSDKKQYAVDRKVNPINICDLSGCIPCNVVWSVYLNIYCLRLARLAGGILDLQSTGQRNDRNISQLSRHVSHPSAWGQAGSLNQLGNEK